MLYRRATVDDIPYFVESRKITLEREDDDSIDGILTEYFSNAMSDNILIGWVAEDNGLVISTVCFIVCPLVPNFTNLSGKVAYITAMHTAPTYRYRGVATNLMREVINDVKAQGIKKILLNSTDMGRSMYEKLGFIKNERYYEMVMI